MFLRHGFLLAVLAALGLGALMGACGSAPERSLPITASPTSARGSDVGNDVVVFALGLLETEYRFGGKNPEAGLDCSGMVSYVFEKAASLKLTGSAADMARKGRAVAMADLQPGDLVFFNIGNRPYSHVGIYIGDQRFVHAPSKSGKVRTDSLSSGWFAPRFKEARTYFN